MIATMTRVRCNLCEGTRSPLYHVPDAHRSRPTAPRAVCRFCFIRLVGVVPRRRLRVDIDAVQRPTAPAEDSGESPGP